MHAGKALLIVLVVGLLGATGLFYFVPSIQPPFVKKWFQKAKGFTDATSAQDALDKFKKAVEKRDDEAAGLYVTADYKEWLDKGGQDAKELGEAIDNLKIAMKKHSVKSDKAQFLFFALDPLPANFDIENVETKDDTATATLSWKKELASHAERNFLLDWKLPAELWNSLLPQAVSAAAPEIKVTIKKEADGVWRIAMPVSFKLNKTRTLLNTVPYLQKNGSNYKNAIKEVGQNVKNNPVTKENFEGDLKKAIQQSK